MLLAAVFLEPESQLKALVHDNIQEAANVEWPMMQHETVTLNIVPHQLAEALHLALSLGFSVIAGLAGRTTRNGSSTEPLFSYAATRILINARRSVPGEMACPTIEAMTKPVYCRPGALRKQGRGDVLDGTRWHLLPQKMAAFFYSSVHTIGPS